MQIFMQNTFKIQNMGQHNIFYLQIRWETRLAKTIGPISLHIYLYLYKYAANRWGAIFHIPQRIYALQKQSTELADLMSIGGSFAHLGYIFIYIDYEERPQTSDGESKRILPKLLYVHGRTHRMVGILRYIDINLNNSFGCQCARL